MTATSLHNQPQTIGTVIGYRKLSRLGIVVRMTYQGGAIGAVAGGMIGGSFMLVTAMIVVGSILLSGGTTTLTEILWLPGAIILTTAMVVIGGALLGCLHGFVLSLLTTIGFVPPKNIPAYRVRMRTVAVAITPIIALAVAADVGTMQLFLALFSIPLILGISFSLYAAQRLARWYEQKTVILDYTYHLGTPIMPQPTRAGQEDNQP